MLLFLEVKNMIIYISKENETLISCLKDINNSEVQTITGVKHLKRFVLQEMKNLNNFEHIIIDLNGFTDTEDEIVDSAVAIKSMYSIRIIIVAIGYEQGNSTLARLFNEGIYNFVTATNINEQEKEISECMEGSGKQYKDSVRFRVVEQINNKTDKMIVKKEYKKLKQCVTIAVAGSQSHIGVTTQSLLITKFLNSLKLNACYIQSNGKEDIQTLESLYEVNKNEDFISYSEIDLYEKDKSINAVDYGYDFYIYDMGNLSNIADLDNFITKDVKVIVSGTKAWEQENLINIFNKISVLKDINFIFSFTPENSQKDIIKNMGKFGAKTYFSKYVPDIFDPTNNEEIYHSIFKEYIAEKSSKVDIVPIKKSIFNIFRR